MSSLAIVIPAYKVMYFDQALSSIANQTCKDFTLYIGNDNSPFDLKALVDSYENRIRIVYKHFNENLGGKDLVAHWERCLDLIGDEKWIWLFSDDDTMDPTCVKNFYDTMNRFPDFDIFHFNVLHIDEANQIVGDFFCFPEVLSIEEFLKLKLEGSIYSTVVEYIFRKSHFLNKGRFQKFDLAWGSDDATWIKLGGKKGIRNIDNAKVYWRESPFNISPNFRDQNILYKKLFAQIEFADWICQQAKQNEIRIEISSLKKQLTAWFLGKLKSRIEFISFEASRLLISKFYQIIHKQNNPRLEVAFLFIYKTNRYFIGLLKKFLLGIKIL
jgi:glycosyltransferase involved in cell wall biosynthesis